MARSSRHPVFVQPRLLIACLAILPPSCIVIWICLFYFAVPYLLNSARVIPTYIGFHIQYPNPNLIGAVHNLRCQTNGRVADGFSYFCRFEIEPSKVEQFVRYMELSSDTYTSITCRERLSGQQWWFPQEEWWKPLDLVGGQCYSRNHADHITLLYSPTSRIAYINDSDH